MKYSILIPAYKAKFLKECLDSILRQTYADLELVVLNDCSPEPVREIVATYSDSRIRYYENEKNVGAVDVVDNWNKLLHLAKGEFVICMGDDDMLADDCLEAYNELTDRRPGLDLYHARALMIDETSTPVDIQDGRPEWESMYSMMWHATFKDRRTFIGDYCFHREHLIEKGGFYKLPLAWGSDAVSTYIAAEEKGVANMLEPKFWYRRNEQSITTIRNSRLKMQASVGVYDWTRQKLSVMPKEKLDIIFWQRMRQEHATRVRRRRTLSLADDLAHGGSFFYWLRNRKQYKISCSQ